MNRSILIFVGLLTFFGVFWSTNNSTEQSMQDLASRETAPLITSEGVPEIIREAYDATLESATFAGGCFWCTEAVFQETRGVSNAISGYAGGSEYNPTYQSVIQKQTSHREAIKVFYDPKVVTYKQLLEVFWSSIDPTDAGGQFVDRGFSYTTAIFYEDEQQRITAEESKTELQNSDTYDGEIVSLILPFTTFYEAEQYHQDFYLNSAERYKNYAQSSGREEFKAQIAKQLEENN